jgi:hypothetical protein
VDLVLTQRGKGPMAIECKWKAENFEPGNLAAFRKQYPEGQNWIVCQNVDRPYARSFDRLSVEFMSLDEMSRRLDYLS